YNANPTSMKASLESFSSLQLSSRKMAKVMLLGDMRELGKDSQKEHRNILDIALKYMPAYILLVGEEFAKAYKSLYDKNAECIKASRGKTEVMLFADTPALASYLKENPLKFADTVEKLKTFKELKEKYEVHRPVIKAQGIWPSVKPHVEEYYHTLAPITDLVAFNPLIDYLDNDTDIVYDEDFGCPQLYQRLVIGEDGKVMACSNDENGRMCMGDVKTQSIHEIWHGEPLNKMREAHSKMGGFKDLELCKLCYLPRKTEDNETSSVDGREFIIQNYVGRTQEIGK
ncbi:MAG: SPASM domain-containing protein, partial [Lachnospiraceae bacterium]|nr:SPASM domain-containing protein [Lachnospiraceae bacterium]